MENKVLKLGGGRSTKDVYAEIRQGNSERWTIQSQKSKYVNGKLSGVIEVGYSVSNDTPILSSRFNPTKKYPLDLNFYWVAPT
jgi:hypothetical protein